MQLTACHNNFLNQKEISLKKKKVIICYRIRLPSNKIWLLKEPKNMWEKVSDDELILSQETWSFCFSLFGICSPNFVYLIFEGSWDASRGPVVTFYSYLLGPSEPILVYTYQEFDDYNNNYYIHGLYQVIRTF